MILKYVEKFKTWTLYYHDEIIWGVCGFILGAIIF